VHCQVLSFLTGSGLSAKPYILGKVVQSFIAAAFTYLAARIYPIDIAVYANEAVSLDRLELQSFSSMLMLSLCMILVYGIVFGALFFIVKAKKILYNGYKKRCSHDFRQRY
jgi:hypothetical protein